MTQQLNMFTTGAYGDTAISPDIDRATHDICENNHRGNAESVAANPTDNRKSRDKRRIMEWFRSNGPAITEAAEIALGMSHQTCSARVSELKRDGDLVKVGTEKTTSGCSAALLRVVGQGVFEGG